MKYLCTLCAIACLLAIFKWPISYYTFLRIIVALGAIFMVYEWGRKRNYTLAILFTIIFILFNPIFPIHLYYKILWMPIDISTAIIFLLVGFYPDKKPLPPEIIPVIKTQKTYSRDRIAGGTRMIK